METHRGIRQKLGTHLIAIAGVAACFSATAADNQAIEFKGIELGASLDNFTVGPKFECRDSKIRLADTICDLHWSYSETIGGAPLSGLSLYFYADKLHLISTRFNSKDFAVVVEALGDKYGKAAITSESVQNGFGTKFEDFTYLWKKPGGAIIGRRFSGSLTASSVTFRSDAGLIEFGRRNAAESKKNAGDL